MPASCVIFHLGLLYIICKKTTRTCTRTSTMYLSAKLFSNKKYRILFYSMYE
jgi:hypothetical protein